MKFHQLPQACPIGRVTEIPADVRRRLEKSKKKNR